MNEAIALLFLLTVGACLLAFPPRSKRQGKRCITCQQIRPFASFASAIDVRAKELPTRRNRQGHWQRQEELMYNSCAACREVEAMESHCYYSNKSSKIAA
jgi:hypothetical protein